MSGVQYEMQFTIKLPDWLPDSIMLGEPMGNILMSVKYRLTAQLIPEDKKNWVASLPALGISLCRTEKALFVNRA